MTKTLIFITFLVCFCKMNAQNGRAISIMEARIALNEGDSTKAIEHYLRAFEFESRKPFDHLKAISILVKKQQYELATKLIEEALAMGYPFKAIEGKDLNKLQETAYWHALLLKKDSIAKSYTALLDQEWIQLLDNMKYADQEIRKPYMRSLNDSILKSKTLFAMELVDSFNFNNLLKRTKTNGFPNYNTVGYSGVNNAWLILWHHRGKEYSTNPLWIEIKPYIEKEINEGNLPRDFLVMFIDHNEIENGRPMIYGSLFSYYRGRPEYDSLEVVDKENLNKRRLDKGLAPIELWLESMKLPMPKALQ